MKEPTYLSMKVSMSGAIAEARTKMALDEFVKYMPLLCPSIEAAEIYLVWIGEYIASDNELKIERRFSSLAKTNMNAIYIIAEALTISLHEAYKRVEAG